MLALVVTIALAQTTERSAATVYEDALIQWALAKEGRALEPAPAGKTVEEVLFAGEDVFSPTDPFPVELNWFHVRTRQRIVAREVLLAPGDRWDPDLVSESERNLRRQYILAVARVVTVQGTHGGVALLVVTKDRWSLRLNSEFTLIGTLLQYLRLRPTEMNFLGQNEQLALDVQLLLDTVTVGQSFTERRLGGKDLYLGEQAALVFNRRTAALEGSNGGVSFGRPLYSLDQPWAAVGTGTWNVFRRRVFRGARVWQLPVPDGSTVPVEYDVREFDLDLVGTRSFGRTWKTEVSMDLGASSHDYAPPKEVDAASPAAQVLRDRVLPRSEDVTSVQASVLFFKADYRVLHDLETYQLSEDWQVGPRVTGAVRWAVPTPLASSRFVELAASARYRFLWRDNLLSVAVAGSTRLRPDASPANNRLVVEVREFSPVWQGGRVVWRLLADLITNDLGHRTLLLGGSNGLRGTLPESFGGRNRVVSNLEWRLRPFELASQWVAPVAFYDVGSAFDDAPSFTHTVGFGFRLLLPHFNDEVIRVDFGMVVGGEPPGLDRVNASYGQVTQLRPGFLDYPL